MRTTRVSSGSAWSPPHCLLALPPSPCACSPPTPVSSLPFRLSASFPLMKTLTKRECGGRGDRPASGTHLFATSTHRGHSKPPICLRPSPLPAYSGSASCGTVGFGVPVHTPEPSILASTPPKGHSEPGGKRWRGFVSHGARQRRMFGVPSFFLFVWGRGSSCPPLGGGEVRTAQEQTGQCLEGCA